MFINKSFFSGKRLAFLLTAPVFVVMKRAAMFFDAQSNSRQFLEVIGAGGIAFFSMVVLGLQIVGIFQLLTGTAGYLFMGSDFSKGKKGLKKMGISFLIVMYFTLIDVALIVLALIGGMIYRSIS